MDKRQNEQMKIAVILYEMGLDLDLISIMTSLSYDDLKQLYQ